MLRRMILVLAVAALMAAMMAVSAMPAMAKAFKGPEGGRPTLTTGGAVNSASVNHCASAHVFVHGSAGGDGEAGRCD